MVQHLFQSLAVAALAITRATACDECYGPTDFITHERVVRRMQPDAQGATYGPTQELEWGQINFLQTTDTHGWLEGHIKEQNYGADWGDFVSFTRHMKAKATAMNVDLLLIDTGNSTLIQCLRSITDTLQAIFTMAMAWPMPPVPMEPRATQSLRISLMTSLRLATMSFTSLILPMKPSQTFPRSMATAM
jgi:hypothetical protein